MDEPGDPPAEERARRAERRIEALELELERAHHLLDQCGLPRELRVEGERDSMEYSLEARIRLLLEEAEGD